MNYCFSNIQVEANANAYGLANIGCNFNSVNELAFNRLPLFIKGFLRLDQLGMPYVND